MGVAVRGAVLFLAFLVAGCASKAIILEPGPVGLREAPEGDARTWALRVATARDVRAPERAGQKVGVLYTRFEKSAQAAFLGQPPELYVKDQLSRFLLHRGWEASSAEAARGLIGVEVEEFSLEEDPGSVWDVVNLRLAYAVVVTDRTGRQVGRVRLAGGSQLKSPFNTKKQAEKGFREILGDTFEALARSPTFADALAALGR